MSQRERAESPAEPCGEVVEEAKRCGCPEPTNAEAAAGGTAGPDDSECIDANEPVEGHNGASGGVEDAVQGAPGQGPADEPGDDEPAGEDLGGEGPAGEDLGGEGPAGEKTDSNEGDGDEPVAGEEGQSGIDAVSVIEAVLFATDEPITPQKLADIAEIGGVREARKHVEQLNEKYEQMACAFRIEEIAGGYQMLTLSRYNPWLGKLVKVRSETKLSAAALETLAIVAYKQPIMRVNIEAIRGVSCGEMVRQLCEKGLVKIVGRAEELGRPLLYGTTKKFLEVFGLSSLRELPQAQELKRPT